MSTPPFINMPDGVGLFVPPDAPLPVLVAEAATGGAGGADVTEGPTGERAGAEPDAGAGPGAEPGTGAGPGAEPGTGAGPGAAPAAGEQPDAEPGPARAPTARGDVLLVPGFTGSKEDFIAILEPLAAFGWRVAAMDLPGQGGAPALGPRGSHTLRTLADSVAAVARWFAPGRRVHLVGHSMGGLVTRELVLSDPASLASWTAMSSGPASIPAHGHTALLQLEAALASAPIEVVWAMKEQLDRAGGWDPPSQDVADFCARRFITNDPAALSDCAEILMTASDLTEQVAAALAAAELPAAVVTGEIDDAWLPDTQKDMAERLGVAWYTLPGLGHNPATEDPQLTAAALNEVLSAAADAAREVPRPE
jgi:pimeloyl-ACP methyl ester carboxylesterase